MEFIFGSNSGENAVSMKSQSEALGAIVLAFIVALGIAYAAHGLKAGYNYLSSYNQLMESLEGKKEESILFTINNISGSIFAKSTISSRAVGLVVFSRETVYYENFTSFEIPQQEWIPIYLPGDVYALIAQFKNASLGVLTERGNLFVFSPEEIPKVEVTTSTQIAILGTMHKTGEFNSYFIGNNNRLVVSYMLSSSGSFSTSSGISVSGTLSVSPVWVPVIIYYTGNLSIRENWLPNSRTFYVTVEDLQGGKITVQMNADGSGISKSLSGLTAFKKMKMVLYASGFNQASMSDIQIYKMPSGSLIAMLYVYPTLSGANLAISSTGLLDGSVATLVANGKSFSYSTGVPDWQGNYYASASTYSIIYASAFDSATVSNGIYACSYGSGTSFKSDLAVEIIDPDTLGSTKIALKVAAPIITDLRGEGYLLNLDPPAYISMASGYYLSINSSSWSLNRNDYVGSNPQRASTQVSVKVTLPNGYILSSIGNVSMSFSYNAGTASSSGGGSSTPPYISTAPVNLMYLKVVPVSEAVPTNATIFIFTTSQDPSIYSNLSILYSVFNLDSEKWEIQERSEQISLIDTPIGEYYGASFFLQGDAKRELSAKVYYNNILISTDTFTNYS